MLNAIYLLPDRKIEPVVFVGLKTDTKMFRDFPEVEVVKSGLLDVPDKIWLIPKTSLRRCGVYGRIRIVLRKIKNT